MKDRLLCAIGLMLVLCAAVSNDIKAQSFPDVPMLPEHREFPDPLVMFDGKRIRTKDEWYRLRRPELKELFQYYMYGYLPPAPKRISGKVTRQINDLFGGKAKMKEVLISLGAENLPKINLLLIVPKKRSGPAPVFLGLTFCGNHTLLSDTRIQISQNWMPKSCPGVIDNQATEAGRGKGIDSDWGIEEAINRGYAIAAFYNGDLAPDDDDFSKGIYPHYRKGVEKPGPHDLGAIAAWAWGAQRAIDYLVTDSMIDKNRIALFGHSRNGKAAILAAAMDERIKVVYPHQAGCGGTAPSRSTVGESVTAINTRFPHWFNDTFPLFNGREEKLPFDQHSLVALVAPRAVLFSTAEEDTWSNPGGQFEMLKEASKVYRFLDAGGLESEKMPALGVLVKSKLGFFMRSGKHSTTKQDWKMFLDFADIHLK